RNISSVADDGISRAPATERGDLVMEPMQVVDRARLDACCGGRTPEEARRQVVDFLGSEPQDHPHCKRALTSIWQDKIVPPDAFFSACGAEYPQIQRRKRVVWDLVKGFVSQS